MTTNQANNNILCSDFAAMNALITRCMKKGGFCFEAIMPESFVFIMLRFSRPSYAIEGSDGMKRYETIDVVQYGFAPFVKDSLPIEKIPKRIFTNGAWKYLRDRCCAEKLHVRFEQVLSPKLMDYLLSPEFGCVRCAYDPASCLFITQ